MGPGHIGEKWAMVHFLVPRKIWPRGPPIAPLDHRPRFTVHSPWTEDHSVWSTAHSPWTIGPQEPQMAKKGHKIINSINKYTQDPEESKRAINSISVKNHHRKGQDPKAMARPKTIQDQILRNFQGYWGQDPLEDSSNTIPVKVRKGPTSGWPLTNEMYNHILILHQFLSRRAQWHSFWDTTQGHSLKGRTD
ncbi:hypothetical protein O181_120941 [Austropuccinia psidii MF-1]|uniref:Uncharacterized protein n=1 Tax=Austropuccinia psidii MF-1 TaxID=1389203 RepID=A0A9Q3Q107_9BASI|nr:hypothetical protein [Austropuccinia psidii MF-1]